MMPSLLFVFLAVPAASQASAGLPLADAGRTTYTIVVHRDAAPAERHAAEELASFLRQITGASFPLREVTGSPGDLERAILVGPDAAGGIIPPKEIARLGPDGYVLRTRANTLAIAGGRPRGTLYGVYSLLEDQCGCRWFTPEVSRIPRMSRLMLPALDRTFVPRLEYRATDYPGARDADWAARNKINGTHPRLDARRGGKIAYGPFVHTFNAILDPAEHFGRHPEYFSEVNGRRISGRTQLCVTNPDVLRIATDTVRRWMREQPEATIFSVSQNDWYNDCTCRDCRRIADEEGSPMGPYLRFVNAIADAVRDEFPGKLIDTLAYQFTRTPPKITRPRPNVIVRLCDIECCFAHPLGVSADVDRRNADFARDLRRWSEIADRLYIWDYVVDFRHSIMPFPNLYTLKPNINVFIDNHVKGLYEEAAYFSKGTEFAPLRTWIMAKTLWDPSYDTDRAIDEFLEGYYGPAAAPIRRYIDLVHGDARRRAVHFRIGESPSSSLFSDDLLARANALFDEAEARVAERADLRHRVRVARLPVVYVEIARMMGQLGRAKEPSAESVRRLRTLFDLFDRDAREEGVTQVSEGRRYDAWAADVKRVLSAVRPAESSRAVDRQRVDDRQVTIRSAADISSKREALIHFIWGPPGIPTDKLPALEKKDQSPVKGLSNLERVDTLTITMEASQKSYAHHFLPKRPNRRLVILHHGHGTSFDDDPALKDVGSGMQRTIDGLLTDGYSVLAVYMPHIVKFGTRLTVADERSMNHDEMFSKLEVTHGSPMKFFLEPVAVCLNYLKTKAAADGFPVYRDFSMVGLSGGGWTTTVYAAIDPTIKLSVPVAGTIPLYLRSGGSMGDTEQTLGEFYRIAGYPDLYVLGASGPGRKQVQILNRRDDCCFGEKQHKGPVGYDDAMREYENRVRVALSELGSPGFFRLEIDDAAPGHMISWNAIVNTILAELNGGRRDIAAAPPTDAFVRGANGHLWHHGPDGWKDIGFPMVGVPAVVNGAVNEFDVFYRNPRNHLVRAYRSSGAGWKEKAVGGVIVGDPAAVSTEKGTIDVVAFGSSQRLEHWRLTGAGVNAQELMQGSEPGLGNPVLVTRGPKQLDVFYRGFDRTLRHVSTIAAPASWKSESLGGTMLDFPTAIVAPDGSLRAYARDQSDRLVEAAQAKGEERWRWTVISDRAGGRLIAGSPGASVQGAVVRVHARTPADGLGTFTLEKDWGFADHGGRISGSPTATPGGAFARSERGGLLLHDGVGWSRLDGLFD